MVLYAGAVSLFFALLWRQEPQARVRLFAQIFLGMLAGVLLLAYLMYFVPPGPPVPMP
jgi:uncharacterized membrane protein YfcA